MTNEAEEKRRKRGNTRGEKNRINRYLELDVVARRPLAGHMKLAALQIMLFPTGIALCTKGPSRWLSVINIYNFLLLRMCLLPQCIKYLIVLNLRRIYFSKTEI